jgi:hypothetical protein
MVLFADRTANNGLSSVLIAVWQIGHLMPTLLAVNVVKDST